MNQLGAFSRLRQILPSVQNFMEALKEDLANRRSVLVPLPSTVDADDIWPLLRAYLAQKDFFVGEVAVADLTYEKSLLAGLCEALNLQWKASISPDSIDHFYSNVERLPDVVYFDGFDDLSPERRRQILQFFTEWADASHIRADQGESPMALCVMTSSPESLTDTPATDTHLGVHWWWGLPSALEIRLICRILNSNRDGRYSLWTESILPAIAGADMALADHLWGNDDLTIQGIWKRLESYATIRQWDVNSLRDAGIEEYEDTLTFHSEKSSLFQSSQVKQLWGRGILYWTPEYGVQLNTAVLALLGKNKEVLHRIWRGQVEYLLPILDQIRLAICEKLTSLYGPVWPYQWEKPKYEEDYEAVRKDPLACELGYMHYLLKTCEKMKRNRNLLPLVHQTKEVRNELAHYRPIEYLQYERLMQEVSIITED